MAFFTPKNEGEKVDSHGLTQPCKSSHALYLPQLLEALRPTLTSPLLPRRNRTRGGGHLASGKVKDCHFSRVKRESA